jgi:hypothetical protein
MLIKMRVKFAAQHPTFGTKNNRKTLGYQQRSPYYWWWAYLRRNGEYLQCCANGGSGKFADLYKDFGDVRSEDFHKWWTEDDRGARLFAEEQQRTIFELSDTSEWQAKWNADNMLVVAVPLQNGVSKRDIQKAFAALLKRKHTAKRGRSKTKWVSSTADYPINRNYTIDSLRTALTVYDAYIANLKLPKKQQKTLWEIGADLRLVLTAMPKDSDDTADNLVKRNRMAASVSRYVKQATAIVEAVGIGKFPT